MDYLDASIPVLLRTARSILDWSQMELAQRSGVAFNTIGRIERCETSGRAATIKKLLLPFEQEGLSFHMDGVSFGLTITGDLAINMRKNVRDQQIADGSSSPAGPVMQTRVRKRKIKIPDQSELETKPIIKPRKRKLKPNG